MKGLPRFYWVTSTLTLMLVGLLLGAPADSEGASVKIGYLDSFTGGLSVYGIPAREAFMIAVDEWNAKGGIDGRKIEVASRDEQGRADTAVRAARELFLDEKVSFVVGITSSSSGIAMADLTRQLRRLVILTGAFSSRIIDEFGHRYIAKASMNSVKESYTLAQYLRKQPFKKYYLIGQDYEYGRVALSAAMDILKKERPEIKVVGETYAPFGTADYTPFITAALALKPDVVITSLVGPDVNTFLTQARPFGLLDKARLVGFVLAEVHATVAMGEKYPPGISTTSNFPFYAINTPESRGFVKKFRTKTGNWPNNNAVFGYNAANLLFTAIDKANSTDTEKVIDALQGLTITGPTGRVTMRACDQQAMNPDWVGTTDRIDPKLGFMVIKDVIKVDGPQGWRSCREIAKLRARAKR
ncbi:MAG: ABC transporter substrate-binding protein [Candidatus Methylomirabilia bacterium]